MAKDPRTMLNKFMERLGTVGEIEGQQVQSF